MMTSAARPLPATRQALTHAAAQAAPTSGSVPMRVSLAFVERRVNVWLRFGTPMRRIVLDRWRSVAVFAPGALCCRVKWIGNDYGTALWQLMVLQAPRPLEEAQRVSGVLPGARILLRADGETPVKSVLEVIDAVEALGIDPCVAAATYWRTVGNRLAAGQPLPGYSADRHAAHLARWALQ